MNAKEELVIKFQEIKERGWIETKRHGDQCLGNTFEDLIGKEEDNMEGLAIIADGPDKLVFIKDIFLKEQNILLIKQT